MKQSLLIIIMTIIVNSTVFSAEIADIIYLKNGGTFKNTEIIETIDNHLICKSKYSQYRIPYTDIEQIIFQGNNKNKGGIVLTEGAISGKLLSYEKKIWKFAIPSGTLSINQPNRILSINFIKTKIDSQYLPENVLVTSIIEWMETRYLVGPDIIKDANVTLKLIKALFTKNKLLITFHTHSIKQKDKSCKLYSYWIDNKNRRSKDTSSTINFPIRGFNEAKMTYDPILEDSNTITFWFSFCGGTGNYCEHRDCAGCKPCDKNNRNNAWFSTPPIDIKWLKSKQ